MRAGVACGCPLIRLVATGRYRSKPVQALAAMRFAHDSGGALDLLCLLLRWASKFAFDLMDVADNPHERQDLLQAHLILCTRHLMRRDTPAAWAAIVVLWSHQFSALMPEPGDEVRRREVGDVAVPSPSSLDHVLTLRNPHTCRFACSRRLCASASRRGSPRTSCGCRMTPWCASLRTSTRPTLTGRGR